LCIVRLSLPFEPAQPIRLLSNHCPENVGFRFSLKALIPSA